MKTQPCAELDFSYELLGGAITILKNIRGLVNGTDDIPYIMEKKKCLKPPTSESESIKWLWVPRYPSVHTKIAETCGCSPSSQAHGSDAFLKQRNASQRAGMNDEAIMPILLS